LADFGFASVNITLTDLTQADNVIQLGYPPRRIDLLTSIDGVAFEARYSRRHNVAIDGVAFEARYSRRHNVAIDGIDLPIIGLADFKTNKRATGRTQDRADVEALDSDSDSE
jgi:hypothetical protein